MSGSAASRSRPRCLGAADRTHLVTAKFLLAGNYGFDHGPGTAAITASPPHKRAYAEADPGNSPTPTRFAGRESQASLAMISPVWTLVGCRRDTPGLDLGQPLIEV